MQNTDQDDSAGYADSLADAVFIVMAAAGTAVLVWLVRMALA